MVKDEIAMRSFFSNKKFNVLWEEDNEARSVSFTSEWERSPVLDQLLFGQFQANPRSRIVELKATEKEVWH